MILRRNQLRRELFFDAHAVLKWSGDAGKRLYQGDKPAWKVDPDGLAKAVNHYELKLPITVTPRPFHAFGMLDDTNKDPNHKIVVRDTLAPEFASVVLWHELTHAKQMERSGYASAAEWFQTIKHEYNVSFYDRDFHRKYAAIPYEREAFLAGINHWDIGPLTVPA